MCGWAPYPNKYTVLMYAQTDQGFFLLPLLSQERPVSDPSLPFDKTSCSAEITSDASTLPFRAFVRWSIEGRGR